MVRSGVSKTWYREPKASRLEEMRKRKRQGKQITYDCFNAKVAPGVNPGDAYVYCSIGHSFDKKCGLRMPLESVLQGCSNKQCRHCKNFDNDDPTSSPGDAPISSLNMVGGENIKGCWH